MTAPQKSNKSSHSNHPEKIYRNSLAAPSTLKVSPPPAPKKASSEPKTESKK